MFGSSGTGASEAIISSIRGRLLVVVNGRYSARLRSIAARHGVPVDCITFQNFEPVEVDRVADALDADPTITHLAFVHHETTTGMLAPLRALGEAAAARNVATVVDAISSVGGAPFHLRDDRITFAALNPNKCLEGLPGISFVLAARSALPALEGCSRSFYFDLHEQWRREVRNEVPFTVPVQVVFAFDAALDRLEREGYDRRVERYREITDYLRDGLQAIGLELVQLPLGGASNIVVPVQMPAGLDFAKLKDRLLAQDITIYSASGALAEGHFFLSAMGAISPAEVDVLLGELRLAMAAQGVLTHDTQLVATSVQGSADG